jgi:periplasmic divalent cation tolerance protein
MMQAPAHITATDVVMALTTYPSNGDVVTFARTLVERRVIACANVMTGVTSIYRWKDVITEDVEQLVIMKLPRNHVDDLKRSIAELHPYEVPELLVFEVQDGLDAYMRWVVAG